MRKKTENMDIIVDKKTVRVTTAVFVTVMTMLAAIAAMFFTTMSVLAVSFITERRVREAGVHTLD